MVVISRLNMYVFISVFGKLYGVLCSGLVGSVCRLLSMVVMLIGMLIVKSYGYDVNDRIVDVIVGLIVDDSVIIIVLIDSLCLSNDDG